MDYRSYVFLVCSLLISVKAQLMSESSVNESVEYYGQAIVEESYYDDYDDEGADIDTSNIFQNCLSGYIWNSKTGMCDDINECEFDAGICGKSGTCSNINGSFECFCDSGFLISFSGLCEVHFEWTCDQTSETIRCGANLAIRCRGQLTRADIDECSLLSTLCGYNGYCSNTDGSYTCLCNEGYVQGENNICEELRSTTHIEAPTSTAYYEEPQTTTQTERPQIATQTERPQITSQTERPQITTQTERPQSKAQPEVRCAEISSSCHQFAHCADTGPSGVCICYPGFTGDGFYCLDIDECELNISTCAEGSCVNDLGGYHCGCRVGFARSMASGVCEDIDECSIGNGGCDQHCHNFDGEYMCSCDEGYLLHIDLLQCVDFDECNLHNGDCSHECVNTQGNYECRCPADMTLDDSGTVCEAIRTCEEKNGGCEQICDMKNNNTITCDCRHGYALSPDTVSCTDVNECFDANGNCQHACVNTPGSYKCACPRGHQNADDFTCEPLCRLPCQNNGICNAPDSCLCPAGYPGPQCTAQCTPSCANGGKCMRFNTCRCQFGWQGKSCLKARCVVACKNGGRCVRPNTCECPDRYQGRFCENPDCAPPCDNGGRCVAVDKCVCPSGRYGSRCQHSSRLSSRSKCAPSCRNGGTCFGRNRCRCKPGFMGRSCERRRPAHCIPPCRNGGTCVLEGTRSLCSCPTGTVGTWCQTTVCPRVIVRTPYSKTVRRRVRESYLRPCGILGSRVCTAWRWNQKRVTEIAYKDEYEFNCDDS